MGKLIRFLLFIIILSMICSGCRALPIVSEEIVEYPLLNQSESTHKEIIRVGINSENVPWTYMQNGTLVGFEMDLLNEISKHMSVEFEYVTAQQSTVVTGLLTDKWDIAGSSLLVGDKQYQNVAYADPYFDAGLAILVRDDSKLNVFEDMLDGKFGVDTGSAADQWLQDHLEIYGEYEIHRYDSAILAFQDLQALNINGVVADSDILMYFAANHPGVKVAIQMEETTPQAFVFRQGDVLIEQFNAAQNLMKAEGTLTAIYEKWFGQSPLVSTALSIANHEPFSVPDSYTIPDVIKVGINTHNAPWEYIQEGEMRGYEVDILNEIANRLDIEIEYIPAQEQIIVSGLLAGQWDMVASGFAITKSNMNKMDFTGPYFDHNIALMTLSDSTILELEHLAGGKFAVLPNSNAQKWLAKNIEAYGPYIIEEYSNLADAYLDLQSAQISGVMAESYVLMYYAADHPVFTIPVFVGDRTSIALATRKKDSLCDMFNETINSMKVDGSLMGIYEKWFGESIVDESSTNTIYKNTFTPEN
ncbi:MAG: transporter substrate-binding domain-containing protein [Anaerolineaceae bacterium]|nr:transporter substrate-binding domain-containing protein [Anaerolineaceae bacterium]